MKPKRNRTQTNIQTSTKSPGKECKQYELDLTDYVRGDLTYLTKERQKKLFEHLRKCAKCRTEFFDWSETFGVMVTKQHHVQAETKKKYAELLEKIKSQAPGRPSSIAQEVFQFTKDYWLTTQSMLMDFQDQYEKLWNALIEAGLMTQEENQKMLQAWLNRTKEAGEQFRQSMKDNWKEAETVFGPP